MGGWPHGGELVKESYCQILYTSLVDLLRKVNAYSFMHTFGSLYIYASWLVKK